MKREEKYKMYCSVSRFCILSLVICCALLPSLPAVLFERGAETFLTFESLRTTNPIFSLLDLLLLGTLLGDCMENRFHLGPEKLKEYFWHCENPLYYLSTLSQNKSESLRTEPVILEWMHWFMSGFRLHAIHISCKETDTHHCIRSKRDRIGFD